MNYLKILWQHLFQPKNASSEHGEKLSALLTNFQTESLSGGTLSELLQESGFEEFVIEDGSLRFRFEGQELQLGSDPKQFALQVSELLLEFEPPSFPYEGLELEETEMQSLDEHFWEWYVFDENFAKDIPDFAKPEFHSLPFDEIKLDEKDEQNFR